MLYKCLSKMFIPRIPLYITVVVTLLSTISLINCVENVNNKDKIKDNNRKSILIKRATFDVFKHFGNEGLDRLFGSHENPDCIHGSLFHNKSCYYFSNKYQKHSWIHSEKFCRVMPLNASLLVINTDEELEFIKQAVLRIKQRENHEEQLVYHIGFNYTMNNWRWINNMSFTSPNNSVNLSNYFNDWNKSLGKCGSIVVLEDNSVILRSTACARSDERFICTYVLNPCYKNDICGRFGKCINYFYKTHCECTTIFFEGKRCDQLSSKGIQTFAAIVIVVAITIFLILSGQTFRHIIWVILKQTFLCCKTLTCSCSKCVKASIDRSRSQEGSVEFKNKDERVKLNRANKETVKEAPKIEKERKSLTGLIQTKFKSKFNTIEQIFVTLFVAALSLLQLFLIHVLKYDPRMADFRNNNTVVYSVCTFLEMQYSSEEIIYLIFAVIVFTVLMFKSRSKRFSNYIMEKYKIFFNSDIFDKIKKEQKDEIKKKLDAKLKELTPCERCKYKTTHNPFYKCLCCLFCCTCCASCDGGGLCGQCSMCNCTKLCSGMDCCKAIRQCKSFWYRACCCCLWKKIRTKVLKSQKEQKVQDDKDKIDIEDTSKFRISWPLPLIPFSTRNRLQSLAIYVAYTYDILNIFMYLYASYLVMPVIPIVRKREGVLVDFLIQLIQVFVIGIKFYPMLAIADMDPSALAYFLCFMYVSIIFVTKTINKAFCSRTEVFIKFTIDQFTDKLTQSKYGRINERFNLTNVFSSDNNQESEYRDYLHKIKQTVPEMFDKYFPKDGAKKPDIIETITTTIIPAIVGNTTKATSFRRKALNKTLLKIDEMVEDWDREFEADWTTTIRNGLESLPLYICLAYLATRYLFSTIELIALKIKILYRKHSKKPQEDKEISNAKEILSNEIKKKNNIVRQHYKEEIVFDEYHIHNSKIKNTNYEYIRELVKNIPFYNTHVKKKIVISCPLGVVYKFYKPVDHFRFSKQFINTFTVAFMIIYFFTVFLLRMSSIFGNKLIRAIELGYKLIFSGLMPSFSFENHDLFTEYASACLLTSFLMILQLCASIKSFQKYVLFLHRGGQKAASLKVGKRNYDVFINLWRTKRPPASITEMITNNSLHYPGYLIAHLVYGYILLYCIIFIIILVVKILTYFPIILDMATQVIIPIIILLVLKIVSLKFLTKLVFLSGSNQRISNLTLYYTISYFNFFFDCFLGFVACVSRIWQTTLVSLICLPRLDMTIFNEQNHLIMKQLDKGHLAYINFVHMEHMYNNPVLNGFCEMLIESMLQSYIKKEKLHKIAIDHTFKSKEVACNTPTTPKTLLIKRSMSGVNNEYVDETLKEETTTNFRYESYRRLRNIFNLYILLSKNKILREYTADNIKKAKEAIEEEEEEIETTKETFWHEFKRISMKMSKDSSSSESEDIPESPPNRYPKTDL